MNDLLEHRYTLSGVTSILIALVMLTMVYVPSGYDFLYYFVVLVLFADGFAKLLDFEGRNVISVVYSLAMAIAFFTFFKIFGTPFSEFAALLFLLDAVLKILPGDQNILCCAEGQFRHVFSGVVTVLTGFGILFGVKTAVPFLSVIAGVYIIADGLIKLEYAYVL